MRWETAAPHQRLSWNGQEPVTSVINLILRRSKARGPVQGAHQFTFEMLGSTGPIVCLSVGGCGAWQAGSNLGYTRHRAWCRARSRCRKAFLLTLICTKTLGPRLRASVGLPPEAQKDLAFPRRQHGHASAVHSGGDLKPALK